MFGCTPRELDARLNPIEIATCGILVFGRFPEPDTRPSLEQFLGDGFAILNAMFGRPARPSVIEREVAANWKLCFHITLEEYHIVAVHPDTFGKQGYLCARHRALLAVRLAQRVPGELIRRAHGRAVPRR
jgi:phenylpropionate dioxygenase-like ring-hydroxylating dioxygenase large terminal subunit